MAFDSLFKNMATPQGVLHINPHLRPFFCWLLPFDASVMEAPHSSTASAANGDRITSALTQQAKPKTLNGKWPFCAS
jgi:hypothetical protein